MRLSAHFSFKKPEGNDVIGPDAFNDNSDTIDKILFNSSVIEDADGTANAITLTELTLENGYIKKFKAKYNNDPTKLTTINSKKVYRAGTTEAPTFIANKAYTVWYNASGDNFFIEASAEGDVEASNVLSGKYFSNSKDTNIPGTMPNNSSINASLSCGESITIPLGYTPGGTVRANSLISQTGGVTANDAKVLNGYTYWKEGIKRTGTMANKATGTPNLIKYVRNNNNRIEIAVDEGYHGCFWDGGLYDYLPYSDMANILGLTANKIVAGNNICGVNGTATVQSLGGIRYRTGVIDMKYGDKTAYIELGFKPSLVSLSCSNGADKSFEYSAIYSDNTLIPISEPFIGTINIRNDNSTNYLPEIDKCLQGISGGVASTLQKRIIPTDTGFSIVKDWAGTLSYIKWYAIG